ncbi:MAG TPA: xanthine dehydrogenase accessory protein XdhC [Oceanospirillaceae bacterium]|nr:xanthine dehydrogenase accessory protein XdhC [Oceanospirillaceae bacterium]
MKAWLEAQWQCEQHNQSYVLVSIVALQGSSPRGVGSKLLVTEDQQFDSIGGGHLEYKAIAQARLMMTQEHLTAIIDYPLGASLGQCCGGKVSLMFEVFKATKMPVDVFGAGHVGRALVPLLAQLPVQVTWVDSRYDMLPKELPHGVVGMQEEHPQDYITDCVANSCYLVMTHHHGVDLALTEAILKRGDAYYLGVIGSVCKGRKFRQRLAAKDYSVNSISHLNCPMGKAGISGKQPMEVAIAIAAQVMDLYQNFDLKHQKCLAKANPVPLNNESLEYV